MPLRHVFLRTVPLRFGKGRVKISALCREAFFPGPGSASGMAGQRRGFPRNRGLPTVFWLSARDMRGKFRRVRQEEGKTRVFFFLGSGQEKGSGGVFFPVPSFCGLKNGAEAYFFGEAGQFFLLRRPCFFPGFKNFSARLHHSSADGAGVQKKIRILSLFQERKREVKI